MIWKLIKETQPPKNINLLVCNDDGLSFDDRKTEIAFLEEDGKWYEKVNRNIKIAYKKNELTHWDYLPLSPTDTTNTVTKDDKW